MLEQQRDSLRELMPVGRVRRRCRTGPARARWTDFRRARASRNRRSRDNNSNRSNRKLPSTAPAHRQLSSDGEPKQGRQERQPNQETRHDQDVRRIIVAALFICSAAAAEVEGG